MTTIAIRLRTQSQQEAEQAKQQLEELHGPRLRLGRPRAGRGKQVWFVYGTLQLGEGRTTQDEIEHSFQQISRLIDRFADEVRRGGEVSQ
jgi:hypothetical protein